MAKANDGYVKLDSGRDNSKPIIILKVSWELIRKHGTMHMKINMTFIVVTGVLKVEQSQKF